MVHYSKTVASKRYLTQGPYDHITHEDVLILLSNIDHLTWRMLIQVTWTTGARISEILKMEVQHLIRMEHDFSLRITRLKRPNPGLDLLPIPLELGIKLQDYIRLRKLEASDRLFPYTRNTVWRKYRSLGEKYLKKPLTPHQFRHGRAYDLAKRNQSPYLIARILGHSDIRTSFSDSAPTEKDLRDALAD